MTGQTGLTRSLLVWGVQGKSLHVDGEATLNRAKVVQHAETLQQKEGFLHKKYKILYRVYANKTQDLKKM